LCPLDRRFMRSPGHAEARHLSYSARGGTTGVVPTSVTTSTGVLNSTLAFQVLKSAQQMYVLALSTSAHVGTAALGCSAAQAHRAASFSIVIQPLSFSVVLHLFATLAADMSGTCSQASPDKGLTLDHRLRPFPQTLLREHFYKLQLCSFRNTLGIRYLMFTAQAVRCLW
jgi:hypothetical protein